THSNVGKCVSELIPEFSGDICFKFEKYSPDILHSMDVVFISLPAGESMKIIPDILSARTKIIDLGGDFRLKNPACYEQYYKFVHFSPELLNDSVYGLPELFKNDIVNANLIANPGCYATSIILPLYPALRSNIISNEGIVISSLSGVSGAGKKATLEYSFSEVNEDIRAYKILEHQHLPEIEQVLEILTDEPISISFIPHLVPLNRGIYTTIVAELRNTINKQEVYALYEESFNDSCFIRIKKNIPRLKDVVNTNYCDIYIDLDVRNNKLILISVLDNLLKGAAGQAVQNMNIMFGLPESYGIIEKEKLFV
ncbi:MAG TPA: N-acetyl-gamma-glutamyl-phosphate reductase, partial [Chitinophagaceae bacterium]